MIHAPAPIADATVMDLLAAGLAEDSAEIHAALMSALDASQADYTAMLDRAMADAGSIA